MFFGFWNWWADVKLLRCVTLLAFRLGSASSPLTVLIQSSPRADCPAHSGTDHRISSFPLSLQRVLNVRSSSRLPALAGLGMLYSERRLLHCVYLVFCGIWVLYLVPSSPTPARITVAQLPPEQSNLKASTRDRSCKF